MTQVKIPSLNVRGLGDRIKRKKMFTFLKMKNFDIVFLQETHSSRKTAKVWQTEWGSKIVFAHGETNV